MRPLQWDLCNGTGEKLGGSSSEIKFEGQGSTASHQDSLMERHYADRNSKPINNGDLQFYWMMSMRRSVMKKPRSVDFKLRECADDTMWSPNWVG